MVPEMEGLWTPDGRHPPKTSGRDTGDFRNQDSGLYGTVFDFTGLGRGGSPGSGILLFEWIVFLDQCHDPGMVSAGTGAAIPNRGFYFLTGIGEHPGNSRRHGGSMVN